MHERNINDLFLGASGVRKRIPVIFLGRPGYVTSKEYQCISQLPLGLSYKQIANMLNLSHRTVEQYITRVKVRIGCRNRQDLIKLLNE